MLVHGRRELWREELLVRELVVQYEARSLPRIVKKFPNLGKFKIRESQGTWMDMAGKPCRI
jgi:hypothetical protein